MKRESWKARWYGLALVLLGFSLGMFVDRLYLFYQNQQRSEASKGIQNEIPTLENLVRFFGNHLALSEKQKKSTASLVKKYVRQGLEHVRKQPKEVHAFLRKGLAIRREFRGEMRKILTPRQRERFRVMVQELDKRRIVHHLQRLQFQSQAVKKK